MFDELYSDPRGSSSSWTRCRASRAGNFQALAEKFDFSKYQTLCDVGGATGQL